MLNSIKTAPSIEFDSLKQFVQNKIIPTSRDCDRSERFPLEIYQELHSMGWLQAFLPTEYGGSDLSMTDLIHMSKELAYGSAGVFTSSVINLLALSPVILYGTPELKKKLCESFSSKFSLWSYCMTEPDTGSDISKLKTSVTKVDGGYILNGKKCFITNAGVSDHLTVAARLVENNDERSFSLVMLYVPANSPGVTR